jgi:hypothetical protein
VATLLLSSVGSAVAGPLGGIAGTFLGSSVDRSVLGGGRQGPRLSDLSVQSSAYGEAIPRLYGTTRMAGNIIWSTDLKESRGTAGGKSTGGAVTTYSYSVSLAVAISARAIAGVRRIWADGKLIRSSEGDLYSQATLRIHLGGEAQDPDPLILAEEAGAAPAYRGLAYAVFEDLQLAEFGNRIPFLSFEVVADLNGTSSIGAVAEDLCSAAGIAPISATQLSEPLMGVGIGRSSTVRGVLETLQPLNPFSLSDDGYQLSLRAAGRAPDAHVPLADAGAVADERQAPTWIRERKAADTCLREVSITYSDPERDYQAGLQRARWEAPATRTEQYELPVIMPATTAKRIAERVIGDASATRATLEVSLPWRYAGLRTGDVLTLEGTSETWRVRTVGLQRMVVELTLEEVPSVAGVAAPPSEAGRIRQQVDAPHGPTVLEVLDLPAHTGAVAVAPRLYLAVAGASSGWRRADLLVSADRGASYVSLGVASVPAPLGQTLDALPAAPSIVWDTSSSVAVELINEDMWLEGRSRASLLSGANLALVGDEIIQFQSAEPISLRCFRLSGLLRGRFGTEHAIGRHRAGDRFVLLETSALTQFEPPASMISSVLRFKAVSPNQAATEVDPVEVEVQARALKPLSPVHLSVRKQPSGDLEIRWIRRSRQGFAWLDGADVPLGEERELYQVEILEGDDSVIRRWTVSEARCVYAVGEQETDADRVGRRLNIRVAQLSATVGAGQPARLTVDLPAT